MTLIKQNIINFRIVLSEKLMKSVKILFVKKNDTKFCMHNNCDIMRESVELIEMFSKTRLKTTMH